MRVKATISALAIALASVSAPAFAQPLTATAVTKTDQNAAIMVFFEEYDAERSALKEMKARFDAAKLSSKNQLSFRLFEKRAARSEASFKYNEYGYVFDQMNGAQSQIPAFLINIRRIDTKSDARAYINRLYGIGPGMTEAVGQAKSRAAKGIMPPKWFYPYVISDARNVTIGTRFGDGPDAPLFADLKGKVAKLAINQTKKIC
jgi:uncharacterized protein (DUF885 family)